MNLNTATLIAALGSSAVAAPTPNSHTNRLAGAAIPSNAATLRLEQEVATFNSQIAASGREVAPGQPPIQLSILGGKLIVQTADSATFLMPDASQPLNEGSTPYFTTNSPGTLSRKSFQVSADQVREVRAIEIQGLNESACLVTLKEEERVLVFSSGDLFRVPTNQVEAKAYFSQMSSTVTHGQLALEDRVVSQDLSSTVTSPTLTRVAPENFSLRSTPGLDIIRYSIQHNGAPYATIERVPVTIPGSAGVGYSSPDGSVQVGTITIDGRRVGARPPRIEYHNTRVVHSQTFNSAHPVAVHLTTSGGVITAFAPSMQFVKNGPMVTMSGDITDEGGTAIIPHTFSLKFPSHSLPSLPFSLPHVAAFEAAGVLTNGEVNFPNIAKLVKANRDLGRALDPTFGTTVSATLLTLSLPKGSSVPDFGISQEVHYYIGWSDKDGVRYEIRDSNSGPWSSFVSRDEWARSLKWRAYRKE